MFLIPLAGAQVYRSRRDLSFSADVMNRERSTEREERPLLKVSTTTQTTNSPMPILSTTHAESN